MTATLLAKRANARVQARHNGEFDIVLSNGTKDRDGEVLAPDAWVQPLPDSIPLNVDHSPSVSDVIGSGRPFIDSKGNLRVQGEFASTPAAQHVRTLVNEGHLRSVSVEFLRRKDGAGRTVHELVGGAFVNVPANPEALVLASKQQTLIDERITEVVVPALRAALADVHTKSPAVLPDPTMADPAAVPDPVAALADLVDQLAAAQPADVLPIANAIMAAAVQLGAEPPGDDDSDYGDGAAMAELDGEVEAKAMALRIRLKASR